MQKTLSYLLFVILFFTVTQLRAEVVNPVLNAGFEVGNDPLLHGGILYTSNSMFPLATDESFSRPWGWNSINYAAIHKSFIPVYEHITNPPKWKIEDANILPYQGERYLLLSCGDIGINDSITDYASASRVLKFEPGQTLELYYFWGTLDYGVWSDRAEINLVDTRGGNPINLFTINVDDVGDYSSTDGWVKFQYEFTENDVNFPVLQFTIADVKDDMFKSYFAIDAMRIGDKPVAGDFNDDWLVNFKDFALFSAAWKDAANDGVINREMDFNRDSKIDKLDLAELQKHWLEGNEPISPLGDFNRDYEVDFTDFSMLANNWLKECDWDCQDQNGFDIDNNQVINSEDLYLFQDDWLN